MTAVIYARYSSDNQREESIEGRSASVMPTLKRTASLWSSTTSTGQSRPKRTIAPSSSR